MTELSLQEKYGPHFECFGCGPANPHNLKVRTYVKGEQTVAHWQPQPHHLAAKDMLFGGMIACILDCHMNWSAAFYLMKARDLTHPPSTVTADISLKYLRPTPLGETIVLWSRLANIDKNRVTVEGELRVGEDLFVLARGAFVAVREGHPAYNQW